MPRNTATPGNRRIAPASSFLVTGLTLAKAREHSCSDVAHPCVCNGSCTNGKGARVLRQILRERLTLGPTRGNLTCCAKTAPVTSTEASKDVATNLAGVFTLMPVRARFPASPASARIRLTRPTRLQILRLLWALRMNRPESDTASSELTDGVTASA